MLSFKLAGIKKHQTALSRESCRVTHALHIPQEAMASHLAMRETEPHVSHRWTHSITRAHTASHTFRGIFWPHIVITAKHSSRLYINCVISPWYISFYQAREVITSRLNNFWLCKILSNLRSPFIPSRIWILPRVVLNIFQLHTLLSMHVDIERK